MFSSEVVANLLYYVYRLVDSRNGETFYVGKGKGNRVFDHLNNSFTLETDEEYLDLKLSRIKEILDKGYNVQPIIHRHGLDESTALEVEAALIDAYPNLTNTNNGNYSSIRGVFTIEEIRRLYEADEAVFMHKLLMINIIKTSSVKDTYNAVRFAWRLNVERAKMADYVLACVKGVIVGCFVPERWLSANSVEFLELGSEPNRYGFVGVEAPDEIKQMYVNKRVPNEFRKKGSAYPVRYSY